MCITRILFSDKYVLLSFDYCVFIKNQVTDVRATGLRTVTAKQ